MSSLYKKCNATRCAAEGCKMRRGTNLFSEVMLFQFPKDPRVKSLWEIAINRKGWKPTNSSRLCNKHFITGRPSKDPHNPDYVPTIFYNSSSISTLRQASKTHFQILKKKRKSSHDNEGETKEIEEEMEKRDTRTISDLAQEDTNQMGMMGQGKNTPHPIVLKITGFSSASTFQKHGRDIGSSNTKSKDDTCEYILPD